ncbi:hypothetical protein ABLB69_12325 [Xenorhabdus khoisanae]|uniref:hypothetical protein n=1 Tax=Xenorhabdus khoisanae TaxID=880157 RepID=UPI0032B7C166
MKPKNLRELKAFSTLKRINDKQCILRSHRTGLQLSLLLFDLVLWLMVFSWNADNYTKSYLRKPSLNRRTVSGF